MALGGRCRFEEGSQNRLRCDQFVNSQATIWRKLTAAKNVHFGTLWNVFCVYSNGFTSFGPHDKGSDAFQRNIKHYGA